MKSKIDGITSSGHPGVKITVSHHPKTDQISKVAAHFLVWSDFFEIKDGLVYTVVLTCVVGVADITTLWVVGKGRYARMQTRTRT